MRSVVVAHVTSQSFHDHGKTTQGGKEDSNEKDISEAQEVRDSRSAAHLRPVVRTITPSTLLEGVPLLCYDKIP